MANRQAVSAGGLAVPLVHRDFDERGIVDTEVATADDREFNDRHEEDDEQSTGHEDEDGEEQQEDEDVAGREPQKQENKVYIYILRLFLCLGGQLLKRHS